MPLQSVRRLAYQVAAVLALAYVAYVVVLKLMQRVMGGPLGEVGECLLVLAAVVAFAVGLFADEASRAPAAGGERRPGPPSAPGSAGLH